MLGNPTIVSLPILTKTSSWKLEVASAFGFVEVLGEFATEIPEAVDGAARLRTDQPIELRKYRFDGIEIGTVRGQVDHLRSNRFFNSKRIPA